MRADALGFFWEDKPVVREAKPAPPKRQPPPRTWEAPDYLPGLAEARKFDVKLFTMEELWAARGCKLVFDIECYPNYFLISFMCPETYRVAYFEIVGEGNALDTNAAQWLGWMLHNFCLVGFNSYSYDLPMSALALRGCTAGQLQDATTALIEREERAQDVLKRYKAKGLKVDHIDLIEVAPSFASLKIYGGRMHTQRMQDLPFPPQTWLSADQIAIVRWYNVNDLDQTALLLGKLKEQLELRVALSGEYGRDLRSKSDAQIAEAVIASEMEKMTGVRPQQPEIPPGTVYHYRVPHFIRFETPLMQSCLELVRNARFVVSDGGNVGMPPELSDLKIAMGDGVYRMGIGGLHSSEQSRSHRADGCKLIDRDVTSYYPYIILNQGLYPQHLGPGFLKVYRTIVERRIVAKKAGNKVVADSLKITINGSFGKLGSKYSVLYAPDLLIQVTVTGQLSLLMLIERLELRGIPVVSANTDGIVIKCPDGREGDLDAIVKWWEHDTSFETEATEYTALYSRDVNNYIAVKAKGKPKTKGVYADPGLSKNPQNQICVTAASELLTKGIPVNDTIRNCRDITQFVTVRTVKGGAVKDGEYLGKSIRWYHAKDESGEIIYARNGNKVPRSDGGRPLMQLPTTFPDDVDFDWYVAEAERVLRDVGYQ